MSILGIGKKTQALRKKDESSTKTKRQDQVKNSDQNDEAKAILAKMEAKKDAGDCPFC